MINIQNLQRTLGSLGVLFCDRNRLKHQMADAPQTMRPNPKQARNLIFAAQSSLAAVGRDPFGVPADVACERLRLCSWTMMKTKEETE